MLADSDCALLIGDPALSLSICDLQFAIEEPDVFAGQDQLQIANRKLQIRVFDLVELWRRFTGFGFVFAMWMSALESVAIDFAGARDEGLFHLDEIIANYESEIRLPGDEFRKYLSENISYSVDDSMQKGLELFFDLAHRNRLIEANRPLAFVAA
jgi:predicted solute-binding protein